MRMIPGIADAQRVMVVDVPPQAGNQTGTLGLGLAWGQHGDPVQRITVAVNVTAEVWDATEIAGNAGVVGAVGSRAASSDRSGAAGRVDVAQAFFSVDRAATVGLDPLVARLDGQDDIIDDGEARSAADVARIRWVVAAVEFRAAGGEVAVGIVCRRAWAGSGALYVGVPIDRCG